MFCDKRISKRNVEKTFPPVFLYVSDAFKHKTVTNVESFPLQISLSCSVHVHLFTLLSSLVCSRSLQHSLHVI